MMENELRCRICENVAGNRLHPAREMMFGTREEFDYVECAHCGTVQIAAIPDLTRHYPKEYYSLSDQMPEVDKAFKRRVAARFIGHYVVTGKNRLGRFLNKKRPLIRTLLPPSILDPLAAVRFDSRILDIGCGSGSLLRTLRTFGFRNLTGADPFIEKSFSIDRNVRIVKASTNELSGEYDLIMLHHSFEHLPDPGAALSDLSGLLSSSGNLLIRIPLVNWAWQQYGTNWVQLDPPRHLHLFTERSFRLLAERLELQVVKVVYDSDAFQFYGSEQYKMDIPMNDERSFRGVSENSIFSQQQIDEWNRLAAELNEKGLGDQACFYLKRKQY